MKSSFGNRVSENAEKKLFLIMPETNTSRECSLSKLALVKNRMLSSTQRHRLGDLTLMSIKNDILPGLDLKNIFKAQKSKDIQMKGTSHFLIYVLGETIRAWIFIYICHAAI